MSEEYYQLNFGKYFRAVYRQKWIVVLCLCSSIGLALLMHRNPEPLYQARVCFWMRGMGGEREILSERIGQLFFLGRQDLSDATYFTHVELMKSSLILQDVVKQLGLPCKTKEMLNNSIKLVRSSISVDKIKNTYIIEIKAFHPLPEMAVKMANATFEGYTEFNKKLFLEQEQRRLQSMEEQARALRKEMGQSTDLITEKIKGDMYMLLMAKSAETRLNLSLGQSEEIKLIDKAEEAVLIPKSPILKIFFIGMTGLFLGMVLAFGIDTFIGKKRGA